METRKRYLVFAGDAYYADGGFLDFQGSADTIEAAIDIAKNGKGERSENADWWHVVDLDSGKIVAGIDGEHCGSLKEVDRQHLIDADFKEELASREPTLDRIRREAGYWKPR